MKYEIDIDVEIKKKRNKKSISYPRALLTGKIKFHNPLPGLISPSEAYNKRKGKSI